MICIVTDPDPSSSWIHATTSVAGFESRDRDTGPATTEAVSDDATIVREEPEEIEMRAAPGRATRTKTERLSQREGTESKSTHLD